MPPATQSTTETVDPSTVTADIGQEPRPSGKEVPEQIGKFELADYPNNDSIGYERVFTPTDDIEYPRLVEAVGISVRGGEWHVKRKVELEQSGTRHNIRTGEPFDTVVKDLQSYPTIGVGFDGFDDALTFAKHHIRGLSQSNRPPKDVSWPANPILDHFRDIRLSDSENDESNDTAADTSPDGGNGGDR